MRCSCLWLQYSKLYTLPVALVLQAAVQMWPYMPVLLMQAPLGTHPGPCSSLHAVLH
jgi:hypothetical protein